MLAPALSALAVPPAMLFHDLLLLTQVGIKPRRSATNTVSGRLHFIVLHQGVAWSGVNGPGVVRRPGLRFPPTPHKGHKKPLNPARNALFPQGWSMFAWVSEVLQPHTKKRGGFPQPNAGIALSSEDSPVSERALFTRPLMSSPLTPNSRAKDA